MKVSVCIPTYNSSSTIQDTLASVFQQVSMPDEILVLDDGSTDNTVEIVRSYGPRVTVFQEGHEGIVKVRNAFCRRAHGDLLAFLDSDDIWHSQYLATQKKLFEHHPDAAVCFTGHLNFSNRGPYEWSDKQVDGLLVPETFDPVEFFTQYNFATGRFGSMSYCCIAKRILDKIGPDPFGASDVSPTEDSHCLYLVALSGGIAIYSPAELVAYRISQSSISNNRLRGFRSWVRTFEILEDRFRQEADSSLYHSFMAAFAAKRRSYGKILMAAGMVEEARLQMRQSLTGTDPVSKAKSSALLFSTYLPRHLQPNWSPTHRQTQTAA